MLGLKVMCGLLAALSLLLSFFWMVGDPSFVFWTAWVPNCRMTWISSLGLVVIFLTSSGQGVFQGGQFHLFACLELRSVLACLLHFCLVSLQWLTKILALPVPACLPTCVVTWSAAV